MADLADIDKQYKLLLEKYSPKDKASSKATRVPKINPDLRQFIDNALFAYDEYESGNMKDNDLVIQTLRNGLMVANTLLNESIINSHIIEDRERSNADVSYALGAEKGTKSGVKKGIKIQRNKHGHNSSPFKEHEKLIIRLFKEYQASLSSLDKKQKLSEVKLIIEKETGFEIVQKSFDYWRSNYRKSNGLTIFKSTNQ